MTDILKRHHANDSFYNESKDEETKERDRVHAEIQHTVDSSFVTEKELAEFIDNGSYLMKSLKQKGFTTKQIYQYLYDTMLNNI